jgi:uncharacterized membrane protein HdeD (DUF308 family)
VRFLKDALVTIALTTAIHLDWHAARPAHHDLSLGLPWHWLLAIPTFALVAWYVARAWPGRMVVASVAIIGIASILGGGVEPVWELWVEGAPSEWAFGALRNAAFATFLAAGVVTQAAVLGGLRRPGSR